MSALSRIAEIVRHTDTAYLDEHWSWDADPGQIAQDLYNAVRAEAGVDTHQGESTQPAELTVYRAEHVDGIPLGTYTTRDAARQHCAAFMEREEPYVTSAEWCSDEDDGDDGPESLAIVVGGREIETGYLVTPVTVASKYDPEADE